MSGATVSVNVKTPGGTLIQIGGVGWDDFYTNLLGLFEGDAESAEQVVAQVKLAVMPVSAGSRAAAAPYVPQQQYPDEWAGAQSAVANAFPQSRPVHQSTPAGAGPAPICPNHNQPAKWVPPGVAKATGKEYQGFYTCAVAERGDRSCRISR